MQNADDSICGLVARTKDSSQAVFGFFNEVENLQPDLISESHEIRYEFSTNSVKVIRGNKKVKVKLSEDILKLLYMKDDSSVSKEAISDYRELWKLAMDDIID